MERNTDLKQKLKSLRTSKSFLELKEISTLTEETNEYDEFSNDDVSTKQQSTEKTHEEPIDEMSSKTRFYRFIDLERRLVDSKLIEKYSDRFEFRQEYLKSIQENKFEEFLRKFNGKIKMHYEESQRKEDEKRRKKFAFVDLEERFLSIDPTRDVKIVFVDDPYGLKKIQSTSLMYSKLDAESDLNEDLNIESFYFNESQSLLCDSPRARDEITLFARRATHRLNRHLPHLPRVPHRVTIVDERDQTQPVDPKAVFKKEHQQRVKQINKHRQQIQQMIEQSKKNQLLMKRKQPKTLKTLQNSFRFEQLFEFVGETQPFTKNNFDQSSFVEAESFTDYSTTDSKSYSLSSSIFTETLPFVPNQSINNSSTVQRARTAPSPKKQLNRWSSHYTTSNHSY